MKIGTRNFRNREKLEKNGWGERGIEGVDQKKEF